VHAIPTIALPVSHYPISKGTAEDLGIDHRAYRLNLDTLEDFAAKDLESAIDIPDLEPEEESNQQVPSFGVEPAMRRIPAFLSITNHDVEAIDPLKEVREILEGELPIRVAEADQSFLRLLDPRLQRRAVPAVMGVADTRKSPLTIDYFRRDQSDFLPLQIAQEISSAFS
jgi:hypothetical protein